MAAGEYVSVSSQADTEEADLARERRELAETPAAELSELTGIYRSRGLTRERAARVAEELTAHDALGAHARDELGMTEGSRARPIQAALASAAAFASGAIAPVLLAAFLPRGAITVGITATTLVLLALLGAAAARMGGARLSVAAARVVFWGAVAMAGTALVGRAFGAIG